MLWRHNDKRHVVVVVGHTGVGVSSLVNLLAGCPVSRNSPDAKPHTRWDKKHLIQIGDSERYVSVYEIPGFGGDIKDGTLINYVRSLHAHRGIDLVLYCMRPMRDTFMPQTFKLLRESLHKVPFVAVVTGLEYYGETMEQWWSTPSEKDKPANGRMLEMEFEMTFQDHVCVTTLPEVAIDDNKKLTRRREGSDEDVENLVCKYCKEDTKTPAAGGVWWRLSARLKVRAAIYAH